VCGATKRSEDKAKYIWWWNEDVEMAIKEKKECHRCMYDDSSVDNIVKYKLANKTLKRTMSVVG
jgi:hypothetical protein